MRAKPILYILHEKENYVEGRFRNGKSFLIDYEDFEKISDYFWTCSNDYAIKSENRQPMHRFILGISNEDRYKIEVDHVNRNRLDNRKKNLRIVTRQENMYNKSEYKNNTSGVKGVKWNKDRRKWQVQINHNKKRIHLGLYSDFEEAKKVRLEAEEKYFKIKGDK